MTDNTGKTDEKLRTRLGTKVEKQILDAIASLRFGTVEVTVHDSKVMQIERKEKTRIEHRS